MVSPSRTSLSKTHSKKGSSFASATKFSDMSICADTLKAISDIFDYTTMSKAQSQFLPIMLQNDSPDVFVKATTGSGKTLGFLIPIVEMIHANKGWKGVHSIILSPTRDLALQTLTEAKKVITYHKEITAGAVIGGTSMSKDVSMLEKAPPQILVATPGRLKELLSNNKIRDAFSNVTVVVMDEADRLLEFGFVHAITQIINAFPKDHRTMLVTATVPKEVIAVAEKFMRKGYQFVDTVGEENVDQSQIDQYYRLANPRCLHVAMQREIKIRTTKPDYKVLFFFPSKSLVDFYADVFLKEFNIEVLKLHGDLPQNKRTRNSETFRKSTNIIMFATDAAGRGMDFPGVTCVLQLGVVDATRYKQRIGRTGRGGHKGESVIILGTDETKLLKTLESHFKLNPVTKTPTQSQSMCTALKYMNDKQLRRTFMSVLGAYKSDISELGWDNNQLIDAMEKRFGITLDRNDPKVIKTMKKLGIKI